MNVKMSKGLKMVLRNSWRLRLEAIQLWAMYEQAAASGYLHTADGLHQQVLGVESQIAACHSHARKLGGVA